MMTSGLTVSRARVTLEKNLILDDVSMEFRHGAVTAVIGPNGAGKSTLLGVAAGTVKPDAGAVTLGGHDIRHLSAKRAARSRAVMPQDTAVAFPFTVSEVVVMGRSAWNENASESEKIAFQALDSTELLPFADREITTLSGGEKQRVAFARVIAQATPVTPASVILLDEPTAAMDIAHAEATLMLARTIASQGAAVGVVLHDIDAAAAYSDHLVLMQGGRVRASGSVSEVCAPEILTEVYGTPIDVFERDGRRHVGPVRAHVS